MHRIWTLPYAEDMSEMLALQTLFKCLANTSKMNVSLASILVIIGHSSFKPPKFMVHEKKK